MNTDNNISVGIIYYPSKHCVLSNANFERPTHRITLPYDATFMLLKKVISSHFGCNFEINSKNENGCRMYVEGCCLSNYYKKETQFGSCELSNECFHHLKQIPDDALLENKPIISHPLITILPQSTTISIIPTSNEKQCKSMTLNDLQIGDIIDALDKQQRWYQAVVIDSAIDSIYVHFIGWDTRWNEWIVTNDRIAPCYTHTNAPHRINQRIVEAQIADVSITPEIISNCYVKSVAAFTTLELDFSSLKKETQHRDIVITIDSTDDTNLSNENECKIHKCVVSMWSNSLNILCQSDYGMKDCKKGIIHLPTNDIHIIKEITNWLYLTPKERHNCDSLEMCSILQLMQMYTIADLHRIEELQFVVKNIMIDKIEQNPNVLLSCLFAIRQFISIHETSSSKLFSSFKKSIRKLNLNKIIDILQDYESNSKNTKDCDDIIWVLQNVGNANKFDKWMEFVLSWIFNVSSDQWYKKQSTNAGWKALFDGWWVIRELKTRKMKRDNNIEQVKSPTKKQFAAIKIPLESVISAKLKMENICNENNGRINDKIKCDLLEWTLQFLIDVISDASVINHQ